MTATTQPTAEEKQKAELVELAKRRVAFVSALVAELKKTEGVEHVKLESEPIDIGDPRERVRVQLKLNKDEDDVDFEMKTPWRRWSWDSKPRVDRIIIRIGWHIATQQYPEPKAGFDVKKFAALCLEQHNENIRRREAHAAKETKREKLDKLMARVAKANGYKSAYEAGLEVGRFNDLRFTVDLADEEQANAFVALKRKLL